MRGYFCSFPYDLLHFEAVFLWLVCLTNVPISVFCAKSQDNNCHTISMTGIFGRHPYLVTLAICLPHHRDCVPMTCILGHCRHSVYQVTLIVPTEVSLCLSSITGL